MQNFRFVYEGGQSRNGNFPVDYILVEFDDGTELYAEATPVENDETGTYDELIAEIARQAEEKGVSINY